MRRYLLSMWLFALLACDPYAAWPDPATVFPATYTPEEGLEPYQEVRWETETWDPAEDLDLAGLYLLKAANHRPGAPAESLAHFAAMRGAVPPLTGAGVRLSFVGDVMTMGPDPPTYAGWADAVAPWLDGDLRLGNLESPTSPEHPFEPEELPGLYAFNTPPAILDGLPLDVVQLTNNHALDLGDDGLEATLAEVTGRGFTPVGVDAHAVVDVGGLTIAVLAYTWGLNVREVDTAHDLFVVPFGHPDTDLSRPLAEIAAARAEADAVVVLAHWGYEYEYYPDPHFLGLARELVAAGADVIVGQGPHVVQPAERCAVNRPEVVPGVGTCSVRSDDGAPRDALVLYSVGDFGTQVPTLPCQVGVIATVELDPDVVGAGWVPVAAVQGAAVAVVPLSDMVTDAAYASEHDRLRAHLGAAWAR